MNSSSLMKFQNKSQFGASNFSQINDGQPYQRQETNPSPQSRKVGSTNWEFSPIQSRKVSYGGKAISHTKGGHGKALSGVDKMTVGQATDNTSVWIREVLNSEGNEHGSGESPSFERHLATNQMIALPNREPAEMIRVQQSESTNQQQFILNRQSPVIYQQSHPPTKPNTKTFSQDTNTLTNTLGTSTYPQKPEIGMPLQRRNNFQFHQIGQNYTRPIQYKD